MHFVIGIINHVSGMCLGTILGYSVLLKSKFLAVFLAIGYFLDVNDIITTAACWMMSVDNLTLCCLIVEAI